MSRPEPGTSADESALSADLESAHEPAPTATEPEADLPPYEQARDELTDIVRQLETGSTTLEQCLVLWERGEYLAQACQTQLEAALQRVENLDATDRPASDAATPNSAQ